MTIDDLINRSRNFARIDVPLSNLDINAECLALMEAESERMIETVASAIVEQFACRWSGPIYTVDRDPGDEDVRP